MRKVHCYCVTSISLQQDFWRTIQLCGHSLSSQRRKRWRSSTSYDRLLRDSWPNCHESSSTRRRTTLTRRPGNLFKRCLHASISYQGPSRPPPIRPALGASIAPRISSVARQGFSDDDFTIRTDKEAADEAAEKARLEREKKAEIEAFERKFAYKRSVFWERDRYYRQILQRANIILREIRASIPSVLQRARQDALQELSNHEAWRRYHTQQIEPYEERLNRIERTLAELEKGVMYNVNMMEYTTKWWAWRHESLREQAENAWQQEEMLKMDEADYDGTLHGQTKGLAVKLIARYADIARLLVAFAASDSMQKLNPRSELGLSILDSQHQFDQHSDYKLSGYHHVSGRGIARLAHVYRDINRIAIAAAHFPETAYEIWLWDVNGLVDKLREGYMQMRIQIKTYSAVFDLFRQIHERVVQRDYLRWRAGELTAPLAVLHGGVAFYNPMLDSDAGTDLIALLRPFSMYTNACNRAGVASANAADMFSRTDRHLSAPHVALVQHMRSYTARSRIEGRDMYTPHRVLRFKFLESLLCFNKSGRILDRELLKRQAGVFQSTFYHSPEVDSSVDAANDLLAAWRDESYFEPMFTEAPALGPRRSVISRTQPLKLSKIRGSSKKSASVKISKCQSRLEISKINSSVERGLTVPDRAPLESNTSDSYFFKPSKSVSKDASMRRVMAASNKLPSKDSEDFKKEEPVPNAKLKDGATYMKRKTRRSRTKRNAPEKIRLEKSSLAATRYKKISTENSPSQEASSRRNSHEGSSTHQSTDSLKLERPLKQKSVDVKSGKKSSRQNILVFSPEESLLNEIRSSPMNEENSPTPERAIPSLKSEKKISTAKTKTSPTKSEQKSKRVLTDKSHGFVFKNGQSVPQQRV